MKSTNKFRSLLLYSLLGAMANYAVASQRHLSPPALSLIAGSSAQVADSSADTPAALFHQGMQALQKGQTAVAEEEPVPV